MWCELNRTGPKTSNRQESDEHKKQARIEEQPAGTVQKQEAEMAPTIAPSLKMRRASAAVRLQSRRHFGDFEPAEGRFHDHLAGKFHASAS
jgi:hypothetical protein